MLPVSGVSGVFLLFLSLLGFSVRMWASTCTVVWVASFSFSSCARLALTLLTCSACCSGVSASSIRNGKEWSPQRFSHPLRWTLSLLLDAIGIQQCRHLEVHFMTVAKVFFLIKILIISALHRSYGMASQKIWWFCWAPDLSGIFSVLAVLSQCLHFHITSEECRLEGRVPSSLTRLVIRGPPPASVSTTAAASESRVL